jgi:hypothetical protein
VPTGPGEAQDASPAPGIGAIALIAAAVTLVLVAFASGYGYHRDELYFIAAGMHLDWAYADQGPLTPLLARAMSELVPGSLTMLRVPSALAAGGTVLLTGLLARELGGSRRAASLAAACAAVASIVLFTGHTLSTSTFDLLIWTALTWLAVRALRSGEQRLWLVAGVVLGVGLLNKPLPAFLAAGLLAGVLIAGPRRLLRSPYVWSGAAIALVLWSPWILWQAAAGCLAIGSRRRIDELRAVVADRAVSASARRPAARADLDGGTRGAAARPCPAHISVLGMGVGRPRCRLHGNRWQALLPGRAAARADRRRRGAGGRLAATRTDTNAQGHAGGGDHGQRDGRRDHLLARAAVRRGRPGHRDERGRR